MSSACWTNISKASPSVCQAAKTMDEAAAAAVSAAAAASAAASGAAVTDVGGCTIGKIADWMQTNIIGFLCFQYHSTLLRTPPHPHPHTDPHEPPKRTHAHNLAGQTEEFASRLSVFISISDWQQVR